MAESAECLLGFGEGLALVANAANHVGEHVPNEGLGVYEQDATGTGAFQP